MVFSSLLFLFRFLPAVIIIYYLVPAVLKRLFPGFERHSIRYKNTALFLLSLIFYAWGEPVYVVLMLFSTVVDYTHGRLVEKFKTEGKKRAAKGVLVSSVVINLSLLCFFKYADLLTGTINAIIGTDIPALKLALPIGISFYTFQTMSYTIDVYRGEAKIQKNIIDFGTYVALFPQLIAGPIVRYQTIADELNERSVSQDDIAEGVRRFVLGLGKKVLLANTAGALWDTVQALVPGEMTVIASWTGIIAYTFQIYFDFSGYSDMAIGLGRAFGFHFDENFNHPYESKSVTEFWRRWHISLGTWFREYVYIPLGGNRCSLPKQIRNLIIVWLLTGIWHGASWNFMMWGAYYGLLLILEKFVLKDLLKKLPAWLSHVYTMLLVIIGWVLFSFESAGGVIGFLGQMFGAGVSGFINDKAIYLLYSNAIAFVVMIFACTSIPSGLYSRLENGKNGKVAVVIKDIFYVVVTILSIAFLVDASYNPFLYFRF